MDHLTSSRFFASLVGVAILGLCLLPLRSTSAEDATKDTKGQPAPAQPAPAQPAPAQPGDTITWVKDVTKGLDKAAAKNMPVMICINAERVDGKGRAEPAAKGLREVVYLDLRVVTKSRAFVCIYLTPAGSSKDYGELRLRFGIDGAIVSPQHIFAMPNHQQGNAPLVRLEYWPYGKKDGAVTALLGLMDKALTKFHAQAGTPAVPKPESGAEDGGAEAPVAPDDDAKRTAWIQKLLDIVRQGAEDPRREALRSLIANDKEGDCTKPVIGLLAEFEKDKKRVPTLTDIVRVLGIPDLTEAAVAMHGFLKHKDEGLRANTAVSLEYIGCEASVDPLKARAGREKVESIANHLYRALGRCGALSKDKRVRALLMKKAKGSKSERASYGPIAGIAYYEKDAKAARAVEKLLKAMGPPGGGRRGGGRGTMKRALLAWALAEIEDPKSATFMREKMLKPLEHSNSWWTGAVTTYYDAVARKCEGDEAAAGEVDEGIRRTLEFTGGTKEIMDAPRQGRDRSKFEPKADWEIEGRSRGGPGGRGGGGRGR